MGWHWSTAEPSPPMLLPQASSVRPSTVLLSWKMMPRVWRMFTSSVAAALIHMALARNPRKANTCPEERQAGPWMHPSLGTLHGSSQPRPPWAHEGLGRRAWLVPSAHSGLGDTLRSGTWVAPRCLW